MATGLHLRYAALSDVGRVRKDNQDSGYAGHWLLTVCDGVGGAARGDIASSTAVQQLRKLDEKPDSDPVALVAGGLQRAHDRIGELVEADPALNGTSTTATVGLFDGSALTIGHVGDSRAYLLRDGSLSQLTKDHTFVQSLIDEGRITEEESRVHPHRNLILKALDGVHEAEPDLFTVEVHEGDRVMLCSDGACGVLDDGRLADILSTGTPDYAVVELVRASLEAGSTDNVTCVVADLEAGEAPTGDQPMLVGAAAELPRKGRGGVTSRFRGHRSGDTGELEPVPAEAGDAIPSDPIDPELARYAPIAPRRGIWVRRFAVLAVLAGLVWLATAAAYSWSQRQYYVSEHDGRVTIFRGVDASLPGVTLSRPHEISEIELTALPDYLAREVRDGREADSLADARAIVANLEDDAATCPEQQPSPPPSPSATTSPETSPSTTGSPTSPSPAASTSSPSPSAPEC